MREVVRVQEGEGSTSNDLRGCRVEIAFGRSQYQSVLDGRTNVPGDSTGYGQAVNTDGLIRIVFSP